MKGVMTVSPAGVVATPAVSVKWEEQLDLATLMRLRSAIASSVDSVPTGQASAGGQAMTYAYGRCRDEVRVVIDESLTAEFDRLFPPAPTTRVGLGLPGAERFHRQRANLKRLQGWLDGQIEYLKFERQARLDAEAKAKPSIGFDIKKLKPTE
jgi:hypothetical protein